MPTISTSVFKEILPVSTRPVATVPRPWMVNTSSTASKKGPIYGSLWLWDVLIHCFQELGYDRRLTILSLIPFQGPQGQIL